jgi:carbonic anhydrase
MTTDLPKELHVLFENNKQWAEQMLENNPNYFSRLVKQQTPKYLWIGCSDSRVPANQIIGLDPGEVFVHRNVANQVIHSDMNCLSVIQFAVDVLKVEHIIVCGHYGCGGVKAVLEESKNGLVDNWVNYIHDTKYHHREILSQCEDFDSRVDRLCELNVIEQVTNVCNTSVVRDAWERGQKLSVNGLVYGLHDGKLRDLNISLTSRENLEQKYQKAISS